MRIGASPANGTQKSKPLKLDVPSKAGELSTMNWFCRQFLGANSAFILLQEMDTAETKVSHVPGHALALLVNRKRGGVGKTQKASGDFSATNAVTTNEGCSAPYATLRHLTPP
jgi:hypothetical protein